MNVKIISVTTHDGKDKSSSSYIYGGYDEKHILLYNNIVMLTDKGVERVYPHSKR